METKNNIKPTVIVKKIIHADKTQVFDAWTTPELMNSWMVGGKGKAKATVDLRVGGKYTNEMIIEGEPTCDGKTTNPDSKSYMHTGEYLEINRPEKLVFTWNSPSVQNTKVTVDFRQVATGTEVTITHELPNEEQCKGHTQGWQFALDSLGSLLG